MEEMRAILDSLMGSDRNNLTTAPTRATFRDTGVCHSYLVDFCPHDLFPNTKSDLGPCPNKHSDALREQFINDSEHDYYKKKYEKEFLNTLQRLVEGVEDRIRRGQQRILGPDETQVEQDKQKKFEQMKEEIASLLLKAQEAGEKGNIAEAETFTRRVTELRCDSDRMTNLSHDLLNISNQEKSLRVCPVCGAMQSLGDATSRFESHVSGKQHVGYERIRATYATLKAKYRPDYSTDLSRVETTAGSDQTVKDTIMEKTKSVDLENEADTKSKRMSEQRNHSIERSKRRRRSSEHRQSVSGRHGDRRYSRERHRSNHTRHRSPHSRPKSIRSRHRSSHSRHKSPRHRRHREEISDYHYKDRHNSSYCSSYRREYYNSPRSSPYHVSSSRYHRRHKSPSPRRRRYEDEFDKRRDRRAHRHSSRRKSMSRSSSKSISNEHNNYLKRSASFNKDQKNLSKQNLNLLSRHTSCNSVSENKLHKISLSSSPHHREETAKLEV